MIYFQLFWTFFLVGCFSFGGGYAMLPLIEHQVAYQGWLAPEQFSEIVSMSGMLPGSIGTNAAAFVGYQTAGLTGAIVATAGMILPSLLLILLIGKFFKRFQKNKLVEQIFFGLRPVVVGLLIYAAINFAFSLKIVHYLSWMTINFVLIFLFALFFLIQFKSHPLLIILFSALAGMVLF